MKRQNLDRDLKLEQAKNGGNMKNAVRKSKQERSGKVEQTEDKSSAEIRDLL
jgi:hypothetical protein